MSASEPGRSIGNRSAPLALALSADGTAIADLVTSTPNGLLFGALDRGGISNASLVDPPSRSGFVPVYTRTFGQLFVVGGNDANGSPIGTITRFYVEGTPPAPLGLSIQLDDVLAATFDHLDQNLYVLDKHREGPKAFLRLSQIDAFVGGGRVIAKWKADAAFDRFTLTTDRDGSLLLAASGGHHVVWRFTPDGRSFSARRVLFGPNPLYTAPLVGDNGYVVYTIKPTGRLHGMRFSSLPPNNDQSNGSGEDHADAHEERLADMESLD